MKSPQDKTTQSIEKFTGNTIDILEKFIGKTYKPGTLDQNSKDDIARAHSVHIRETRNEFIKRHNIEGSKYYQQGITEGDMAGWNLSAAQTLDEKNITAISPPYNMHYINKHGQSCALSLYIVSDQFIFQHITNNDKFHDENDLRTHQWNIYTNKPIIEIQSIQNNKPKKITGAALTNPLQEELNQVIACPYIRSLVKPLFNADNTLNREYLHTLDNNVMNKQLTSDEQDKPIHFSTLNPKGVANEFERDLEKHFWSLNRSQREEQDWTYTYIKSRIEELRNSETMDNSSQELSEHIDQQILGFEKDEIPAKWEEDNIQLTTIDPAVIDQFKQEAKSIQNKLAQQAKDLEKRGYSKEAGILKQTIKELETAEDTLIKNINPETVNIYEKSCNNILKKPLENKALNQFRHASLLSKFNVIFNFLKGIFSKETKSIATLKKAQANSAAICKQLKANLGQIKDNNTVSPDKSPTEIKSNIKSF